MTEKIRRLESDTRTLQAEQKDRVTFQHFDAVIEPLRRTIENVEKDIKEILRVVSSPKDDSRNHQI